MLDEISHRLKGLGGAARQQDVGSHAAVRAAVGRGVISRVGWGVYALVGAPPAVAAAAVHGGAVGCISAAELSGLAVLTAPARPHVSVPPGRGRRPSALRDGVDAVIHKEHWVSPGRAIGVAVAPVDEALARMLLCCDPVTALVSVDHALNTRRTTAARIRSALPLTAPMTARLVLARADGRAQSPLETVARLALAAAGFTVDVGPLVPGVGYVDLVVGGRVVVELDGFEFHRSRRQFREDRRRDRELIAQGYLVLRFTSEDVLYDIDRLVAAVEIACARAGVPRIPPHL